jgi:hypothetical protein
LKLRVLVQPDIAYECSREKRFFLIYIYYPADSQPADMLNAVAIKLVDGTQRSLFVIINYYEGI